MSTLILVPNPILRTPAAKISEITPEVQQWLTTLSNNLRDSVDPPGVGLAAPQIGLSWRAFATQLDQDASSRTPIRLFLNPVIKDRSEKLVLGSNPRRPDLEGCLSIPELYAPVLRSEWVTVQWQTLDWNNLAISEHTETFFDFAARVIQHEIDHLDGVLFTDHVLEQNQPLYRAVKDDLVEVSYDVVKDF